MSSLNQYRTDLPSNLGKRTQEIAGGKMRRHRTARRNHANFPPRFIRRLSISFFLLLQPRSESPDPAQRFLIVESVRYIVVPRPHHQTKPIGSPSSTAWSDRLRRN